MTASTTMTVTCDRCGAEDQTELRDYSQAYGALAQRGWTTQHVVNLRASTQHARCVTQDLCPTCSAEVQSPPTNRDNEEGRQDG